MSEKELFNKTVNLIDANIKNSNCNYLIERILNTDIENDNSSITWFDELQQIINRKEY